MSSDKRTTHLSQDAIDWHEKQMSRRLGTVARRAVERAEDCLADIASRADEENRDRGARSVESLMRVAKAAVGLREQLERIERDYDRAEERQQYTPEDAERILSGFERELDRLTTKHAGKVHPLPDGDPQ